MPNLNNPKNQNNQLSTLLNHWYPKRDKQQWVLGTIFYIEGSSYRKPGAMMLFGDLGEQYGLLSGGCLESDLMRHARKVMDTNHSQLVTYDMTDEDDIGWQLGIGCGGLVKILLQPLTSKNAYLGINKIFERLNNQKTSWYVQKIDSNELSNTVFDNLNEIEKSHPEFAHKLKPLSAEPNNYLLKSLLIEQENTWLITPIFPAPHLMIFGGGVDASPVVEMAKSLGWDITLVDKRPAYARKSHFPQADNIIKDTAASLLTNPALLHNVDGVVIMTHNIIMDGEALKFAQKTNAKYVGLLGPAHRRERILKSEGLVLDDLNKPLSSPIGLDIGGQLPESIALSILSECHKAFYKK